ncbi:MAG: oligosaccharide flippase family protein [bacterium]|nr:oligosaccharide flippase family protein [bacterium]
MIIERKKNAVRNIVWGFGERIIGLLLPFLTRTVMIKELGVEYLGLNSLFTSILSVLSISELGMGTAIVFSMYRPIAENDTKTLCALLNYYKKIYHVIGTVILFGGLALLPFLPGLIHGTYPNNINLSVLYLIFLFNTVISYYMFAYKSSLFNAFQRKDLVSKRTAIVNILGDILKIIVLIFLKNYYAYAILIPLSTIVTNLLTAFIAKKYFPNIQCVGNITKEMSAGIKKRVVGLFSFKIYGVVFTSVDTIVISAFLGLTPLAIYNNYYYVQSVLVGFLTIFTSSVTAGIGNKMVTNNVDDNYDDFKRIVFLNGWIVSWCSVCMFCLYQSFMILWVGKELCFPFFTMVLMVLYFLIPRITTIAYTYREAAGLWWEDRFRPLIAAIVNLSLNLFLVKFIGMNGVLISTLFCSIFINIPVGAIILFNNYFKRSPMEYFMLIIYYLLITVFVGGITYLICLLIPDYGLVSFIIKIGICFILPNILFVILYRKRILFLYAKSLVQFYAKSAFARLNKN